MPQQLPHIVSAVPVAHGILKMKWDDGYEGVVDLRPVIARGRTFTCLQDSAYFATVRVSDYGHSIYWGESDNETVDFGCDRLRELAEEEADRSKHRC